MCEFHGVVLNDRLVSVIGLNIYVSISHGYMDNKMELYFAKVIHLLAFFLNLNLNASRMAL